MKQESFIVSRAPYITFGITIFLLGIIGQFVSKPTLPYSLLLAFVCLILTTVRRTLATIHLIDIWIVAYLYLYLSEYLLLYNDVQRMFLQKIVYTAEGFIVASFGATLLGYGLIIHPAITKWAPPLLKYNREKTVPRYHKSSNKVSSIYKRNQTDQTIGIQNDGIIPILVTVFVLLLVLIIYFYVFEIVTLQQLFYLSRSEKKTLIDIGLASNFFSSIIIAFPVVSAFLLSQYNPPMFLKGILITTSVLAIMTIFAQGSRSPLGFQLVGIAFFSLKSFRLSKKKLLLLGFLFLVITSTQAVMRTSRIYGIGNMKASNFLEVVAEPESHLSGEGVLRINALIHSTKIYANRSGLPENLFILYWWIPRQIWPKKPTMAGYWIIRDYSSYEYEKISENHSVSGGFSMLALIDFGPVAGALFSVIYGLWLAIFETYAQRYRDTSSPHAIMVALLFFGVFFMMRSLFTSLILIITIFLIVILPLLILFHLSKSRVKFKHANVYSHQHTIIHTRSHPEN